MVGDRESMLGLYCASCSVHGGGRVRLLVFDDWDSQSHMESLRIFGLVSLLEGPEIWGAKLGIVVRLMWKSMWMKLQLAK